MGKANHVKFVFIFGIFSIFNIFNIIFGVNVMERLRKQNRRKTTDDAVEILHSRYIKDDAQRKASLQAERENAHVARLIYDLRTSAGLSQKELAERIGTTQSVISRLEDADYEGHSLSILNRIAKAFDRKLTVLMTEPGKSQPRDV